MTSAAAMRERMKFPTHPTVSRTMKRLLLSAALLLAPVLAPAGEGDWSPLFNGKDLTGWTPKITGCDFGDNHQNTFRVEDGLLKVRYDGYPGFAGRFGHLFYQKPFKSYRVRVEYRFVGEQCKGGPGWAHRNSGVMIHCQDPQTIRKDQDFPVSIEVQLLGGAGKGPRTTGNLCTPGTNVVRNGQIEQQHCISSTSDTFDGDQWVTAEIEVRGTHVKHLINGTTVLEYDDPQLDPRDRDAKGLIELADGDKILRGGFISLQSESHPIDFRKVEVMELAETSKQAAPVPKN
jgi:hypothetical protein